METSTTDTQRNRSLDGVRGWAAVAVVVFHSVNTTDSRMLTAPPQTAYGTWAKSFLLLVDGSTAVSLFFILSGCVLAISLRKSDPAQSNFTLALTFAIKRVLRIYPATIACITALAITFWLLSLGNPGLFQPFALQSVLINMTLFDWSVHGATWTLNIEMYAVPALIITGLAARRIGDTAIYIFVAVAVAIHFGPSGYRGHFQNFNMIYFAVGCLVPTSFGKRATSITNVYVALALMIYCRTILKHDLILNIWVLQALAGFLFIAHLFYDPPTTRLSAILLSPLSQFLGKFSFSLYLWNVPILLVMGAMFQHYITPVSSYPIETGAALAACVIMLSIPVAVLSERYIEQPFIAWGRKIDVTRATATATLLFAKLRPKHPQPDSLPQSVKALENTASI